MKGRLVVIGDPECASPPHAHRVVITSSDRFTWGQVGCNAAFVTRAMDVGEGPGVSGERIGS